MLLRALMPHWLQMITFMGLLFHLLKIRESLEFLWSSKEMLSVSSHLAADLRLFGKSTTLVLGRLFVPS